MKLEKQNHTLPVKNFDGVDAGVANFIKHGTLLGGSKRALIVGSSSCGKTNLMLSLLEHPNGLRFENIYIYCKTLSQGKYAYLKAVLQLIKDIEYFEFEDGADVIPPNEAKPNSIIIFDDVVSCNQNIIQDYFSFGRHRHLDVFFLSQGYSSVKKQLLRENTNFIVLFKQDNLNLKHVYDDHVGADMRKEQFTQICHECWSKPYGFLTIDKDSPIYNGRYRKGLDCFITDI